MLVRSRTCAAVRQSGRSPPAGHPIAAYQPLYAAKADLLRHAGERTAAAAAYTRAISLSANAVERAELERRRAAL